MVRVRIAPSPTGSLHIGTARTALFNYLFAKKFGGHFILRIEDTDLERSDKKYEKDIFDGLAWLGIEADESPEKAGAYGPYRQSERLAIYRLYLEKLLNAGSAFYCFHSEDEMTAEKEKLMADKKPLTHWCEFRDVSLAEAEKKLDQSRIIRFKTPRDKKIIFQDLIRGELSFDSNLIGDFSIAKDIAVPLYNFAVAIDDEEMKISHIIRGEDHISNTPKQLLLIEALGFHKPEYAHLPLILGADRSKLSKRHGAASLMEYRDDGYLPEALFNFLALVGWRQTDDMALPSGGKLQPAGKELFLKDELIQLFSLEEVQKAGAIFDIQKLNWLNGEYIRKKSVSELTELCKPYLKDFLQNPNFKIQISKIIELEQPRLKKLSEIGERVNYFFRTPEYNEELLRWKNMTNGEVLASLEKSKKIISDMSSPISKDKIEKKFLKEIGDGDKGKILWPLRAALTGKKASPGPFEILEVMGREIALDRIAAAKQKITA